MEEKKEYKRRVRYGGTHPKKFSEKYKEHQPEKYKDVVEKVISKGSTPAGTHISIMVEEILGFLQIKEGQTGLDATLGFGGHTLEMMKCLNGKGHHHALDIDPIEIEKTKKRLLDLGYGADVLTIHHMNFAEIETLVDEVGKFDYVLADLGVSSMQIDNPERGFSFKVDGPLDLRLNPERGISAAERLQTIELNELMGMLIENADELYAEQIARKILSIRKKGKPLATTTHLKEAIEGALFFIPEKERKEAVKKSCQRTFQALRIDVNQEFEVLHTFLGKLPHILAPNGRVAILTFHSGEDRLVKKSFKELEKEGVYAEVAKEIVRPSVEECARNPRSRSTKMRWAIKS